jgi:uncharacterized damage-inducible protein DinB
MYRKVDDFLTHWKEHTEDTRKLLDALTDASLSQEIEDGHRTLGRIAWHIVLTVPEMLGGVGLHVDAPGPHAPVPATAKEIATTYGQVTLKAAELIRKDWTDATLLQEDEMYGERWTRGVTLRAVVNHEVHHRGQMTVLMRQAGLKVPGIYGPALEEWPAYGMEAPAV